MRFEYTKIREARGDESSEHAASGLLISASTLRNWETGRSTPSANSIALLADYYGKSTEFFYSSVEPDTDHV